MLNPFFLRNSADMIIVCRSVILEGDSSEVITAISTGSSSSRPFEAIVEDLRHETAWFNGSRSLNILVLYGEPKTGCRY